MHNLRVSSKELKKKQQLEAKRSERWLRQLPSVERVVCSSESHGMKSVVKVLVAQSCPTLLNPTDCSLPDSSVHGILQARILD